MNKTALFIGANSDIAKETYYYFAKKGYDIQLAARNISEIESSASDVSIRYNRNVKSYELDITKIDEFDGFISSLEKIPDCILCAVGDLGDQTKDEKSESNTLNIINVNYVGPTILLNMFANIFIERGSGTIIGISSVAGERGRASNYIYGSAKSGFTAALSGLRNRLYKHGIRVITVKPGFVKTKMTESLTLPKLLTTSSRKCAKKIYHYHLSDKDIIYISRIWRPIMLIIKLVPEKIFKRLKL